MRKRKLCVVSGSRADYGLLYWLMKELDSDNSIELQIVVTGMHLSPEFGNTYQQIKKDGFTIDKKVHMLMSSDTSVSISKSMGLGIIGFADVFDDLCTDLIVVLGDRFEIFSAVCSAMIANIPVAHIHGGETTEGAYDEYIRHSITKMSHLHFAATNEYKNRIIQLGEHPNRVFNVGGLGIENINKLNLLSKDDFENAIGFNLGEKNIMVTFHPVTLDDSPSKVQFQELLDSLSELNNTKFIFTKSNADTDGRIINKMIDDYTKDNDNAVAFTSMGQVNYLSSLQFVDGVVGNSSSGIVEAPSFNIGTIDIGDRQKGRIKANSVISCLPNKNSINSAFDKLYSKKFSNIVNKTINPYENGESSKNILNVLKNVDLNNILKKTFFNIIDN